MTVSSHGYVPKSTDQIEEARAWKLFCENIDLLLKHQTDIFDCADYFFCTPVFSSTSWPYISGDGPLFVGYLLLGWSNGWLTGDCPKCGGRVLVTSFAGSPLSGGNKWTGFCLNCRIKQKGSWSKGFGDRVSHIVQLKKKFPSEVEEWEEYDGSIFSWGGNGLKPAKKKRYVRKQLAAPVSLQVLIEEIESGDIRPANAPNVSKLNDELRFKFSDSVL